MYEFLKGLHNLLRWVVVLGGAYALIVMIRGLATSARCTATEGLAARVFTYGMHSQLLIGLILYGVTPLVRGGMSASLSERLLLIEHATIMLLAVVAAQLGTSLARRAEADRTKFLRATLGYGVAALFIVWATPWGRSLLPWA
jgi:hypothetical protein